MPCLEDFVEGRIPENITCVHLCVASPKLAPCPKGKDRVGKENDASLPYPVSCTLLTPLDNMHQINHCPQGGLGVDGNKPVSVLSNVDGNIVSFIEFIKHGANENKPVCVVPLFIQDPASSMLEENHQLDDMHPVDAMIDESLAADSSPSPHAAPVDQHGKAHASAQLALGKYDSTLPVHFGFLADDAP